MRHLTLCLAVLPLLQSCGGGSSAPGGAPVQAPAPSPAPPPAPIPTPTPAPTLAADPGGVRLGGLAVPGTLAALLICSDAEATLDRGKVVGIGATERLFRDELAIEVDRSFVYSYDINGFGGPTFGASTRLGGEAYETFVVGSPGLEAELQLDKTSGLDFATLGLTHYYNLCFLAAAPLNTGPPPSFGQRSYDGFADGLHQAGGDADRLYGSTVTLLYQESTQTYAVAMTIRTVEDAFAEPAGQTQTDIGRLGATLTLDLRTGQFASAPITGPAGFTGTITGRVGGIAHAAALLTFEMSNPAGERIWGVIATDGAQI